MITIVVNNAYTQILELDNSRIIHKIDNKLSFFINGYQFAQAYKLKKWDGKKHLITNQLKFQTGLLPYVEDVLISENIKYKISDNRKDIILGKEIKINSNYYTPRNYQIDIVDICLQEKCGLVKAATGAGKTLCLSMLIGKTNIKTVIYVISLDLLYQTKKSIEDALGIECGIVGDGQCSIKKITIATPWTINNAYDKDYNSFDDEESKTKKELLERSSKVKIQKMVEDAQMFIFDEVQFLAADSFQLIAKNSKNARYRIGMSATPWRDDGQDLALTAATGKLLIDISATALIEKGVLVKPKIYFFDVPELNNPSKWNKEVYSKIYDNYIVDNQVRNDMIIESVSKLYLKERKTLVLVKRKKHGLKILEMMPKNIKCYMLNGDASSEERQAVKDLFNMNELDVIIASSIFDTGIDLPMLDALILAGGGKSSTRALQRLGRILRLSPGKLDAIAVDFIDNIKYLLEHSQKRYDIYNIEQGFEIKLPLNIKWPIRL